MNCLKQWFLKIFFILSFFIIFYKSELDQKFKYSSLLLELISLLLELISMLLDGIGSLLWSPFSEKLLQ
jgi:hypothetical protein